ncbi:LTA synthase family protein [Vibrio fluvialis]|uniref:LTA synthase family protein n=1 Tax=Vibrio fluvialis TaxID=676 RepID=UPI00215BF44C|nr:LTA synthase family protein [Vibrio fluvialis]MCR9298814.1 LTA synthase family protein [Vibrio fluvialis]
MKYPSHLRQLCLLLLQCFLFSFSLLLIARVVFFLHIRDVLPEAGVSDDIGRAFWVGGRFDAKVTAIAYAPLLLSGLIAAAFHNIYRRWLKFALGYHSVIAFLYVVGGIGNYYYYLTYGSYVDLFVFGLWEDDTNAVLINMWQDYPIMRGSLLSVLAALLAYVSSRWFLRTTLGQLRPRMYWHWSMTSLVVLLTIVVTFAVARGSLDSHPLKRYHASVSQYKPLNMITPNVFMALDWATTDYKEQRRFDPVSQRVLTTQMEKMLGQPTPNYHVPTNPFLADNPPHVVVAMMESMGMNILVEDDPQTNDLLGSLRPYWENGFLFERFMAGTSATIDSIVMTLFHSPVATISHSSIQNIALPSSAVLPYKRAGYEVTFLYGGNGMWRNLANYLPVQGFDRVYDENDIIEAFPEAAQYSGTWGVPDGYLFKYANKVLEEAKKPTLIFIMTVTNHSPYKVPDYYQPKPTAMSERLSSLIGYQGDQAKVLLNTFQYASDALGQFIGRVKASDKLKDNTVIAVTGDHRMRYSSTDEPTEYGLTFAVPFFLDVPQPILDHSPFTYDPQRIGSHRDLFPTLYHFSLSNQDYISLGGENLLATDGVSNIGFNASRTISEKGAFSSSGSGLFYAWDEHNPLLNQARPEKNPPQETDWGKEYSLLQDYYLRSQVLPMTP